jgi:hypothetical protein
MEINALVVKYMIAIVTIAILRYALCVRKVTQEWDSIVFGSFGEYELI